MPCKCSRERSGIEADDDVRTDDRDRHGAVAERDEFVKATRPVYTQWKGQIGNDLVTKAEQSIAARK